MTDGQGELPIPREDSRGGRESVATKVRSLVIQVATIRRQVDELRESMPEQHREEHGRLRADVARITRQHDRAPAPFWWGDVPADEQPERERSAREWVATVLGDFPAGELLADKPCWWQHVALRHHLLALWTAWMGAYRAADRKYTDPDDWITKRLPVFATAAAKALGPLGEPCNDDNHHPPRPAGL